MVRTGTLLDTGMVYFDARLSQRYPTLEVRIADVCLRHEDARHEDAVLIAALMIRAGWASASRVGRRP